MAATPTDTRTATSGDVVVPRRRGKSKAPNFSYAGPVSVIRLEIDVCEQTLPPDAVQTTIDGHRAAWYRVTKPTDWNNRWWFSCLVTFKTSHGVIQQSLFFATVYSNPNPIRTSTARWRA